MTGPVVYVTKNFEANLDSIELFLNELNGPHTVDSLLDLLFNTVVPNLERFPRMGVNFLDKQSFSCEGQLQLESLRRELGGEIEVREYITKEYLILYALKQDAVFLLSIKHHRQLSFELSSFWTD